MIDPRAMTADELAGAEEAAWSAQQQFPTAEGSARWQKINDEIGRRTREAEARGLKSWRDVAAERT